MAQNPKPTRSGMFTNLQSYLRANTGQSGRLAGDISQNIEKQADSALQEYETQAQALGSDIDAASITSEMVSSAASFASGLADVSTDISGFLSPTNDVVTRISGLNRTSPMGEEVEIPNFLEEQQKEQAARIRQGFGDVSLDTEDGQERFQKALGLGEQAEKAAGETDTSAGRKSLLEQQFGRPDYTTGEKSFDELLISGDQEARNRFQGLRQSLTGEQAPTSTIQKGRQELIDRLSQARSSSEALKSQYEQSVAQAKQNLLNNLDQRANNLEKERTRAANQAVLNAKLGGVDLQKQSPEIYGVNLAEYLKDPITGKVYNFSEDLGGSQVATAEDVGKLRALYELAGLDPNTIDPAFSGNTFTQQALGAPELRLKEFEQAVKFQAEQLAKQVIEASVSQVPSSDQLSYKRMADEIPFRNAKKHPEMVRQAQETLENQILSIAEQDQRLGSGAATSAIQQRINEGRQATKMASAYEALLRLAGGDKGNFPNGDGTKQFDQKPARKQLELRGISSDMVKELSPIVHNPVFKAFVSKVFKYVPRYQNNMVPSNTWNADAMLMKSSSGPGPGFKGTTGLDRVNSADELNEKYVQPIFNTYAASLNNPRLSPQARQEIQQGLEAISSFVEALEHKEFLREFSKNPKSVGDSLVRNAYMQDAETKLNRLKGN